jgi:enamine deaminase RidA (YjgF/YER057c/UK114 family)
VKVQLEECTMLFISGKVGVRPDGTLAGRTMREQTQQTLENIREVLQREGATMDDIVRVRVYATQVDSASLRDIHDVRSKFWTQGKYPASTLVRVDQLIRDGAIIEIDADAVIAS